MPALPSFITGRKPKASGGSKSPFYIRRGEPTAPPPPPTAAPLPDFLGTDVIDINSQARPYSLDFDGGRPNDEFEKAIFDEAPRLAKPETTISPQVKLDIQLSPEALTDWFTSNFLAEFPETMLQRASMAGGSGLRNEALLSSSNGSSKLANGRADPLPRLEDGRDDDSVSTSSSEDVIANLQAMNPSHFGKMPDFDDFNRLDQPPVTPKKSSPKPIAIPGGPNTQNGLSDMPTSFKPARPVSTAEELVSSAVSGSTLARALMSNPFTLPSDNRASRFLRGAGGLTRSDSTTLPRSEHSFGAAHRDDVFSIGPDAPPIPSNAEALYQPPKKSRGQLEARNRSEEALTRQASGNSIKALPKTPSSPSVRPDSALLTPGVEFDMNSIIQPTTPGPEVRKTPLPRSPLPLPPTPKLPYLSSEDGHSSKHSSKQGSIPDEYQMVTQHFPLDSQLISPDLNQLSPAISSEGPQSGKDLDGVLNYYSLPETPDIQPSPGFQPAFSPISEESSSQLSPPLPYRIPERRDSARNAPLGGRSPSGSPRIRQDSAILPRRPSDRNFSRAPSLLGVSENANANARAASPSSSSSSKTSYLASELLVPPPVSTIFNRTRAGSAPSPIKVIRDSKDVNAYKITVGTQLLDTNTPTDEDGGISQEFPETPNMFSPLLTGDSGSASMRHMAVEGADAAPMPIVPRSATLPRGGSQSFAQALLLNRSGTTIGHSRQPSTSKVKMKKEARSRSPSTSAPRLVDISSIDELALMVPVEDTSSTSGPSKAAVQAIKDEPVQSQPEDEEAVDSNRLSLASARFSRTSSLAPSVSQESDTGSSMYSTSESSRSSKRQRSLPPVPPLPSASPSVHSPSIHSMSASPAPSHASLPTQTPIPQPPATAIPEPVHVPTAPPQLPDNAPVQPTAVQPTAIVPRVIPPPPTVPAPSPTPSQKARPAVRGRTPPTLTISSVGSASENTVAINGPETAEPSPTLPTPESATSIPPTTIHNPNALSQQDQTSLTYKAGFLGRDSDIFRGTSLGSPPPYYQAISDAITHNDQTPTTGFPGNSTFTFPAADVSVAAPANTPAASPPTSDWTNTPQPEFRAPALARENSIISQRSRMRPPLPAGPRRPSQGNVAGLPFHQFRDRSGSVSSVASSNLLMHAHAVREREAGPIVSPKFQTPSPKWRGYTMDAAKWTFTSAQLQAIVSRAIRQSAEASSIRLLRLEILDNEIPEEMRRLEAQRTDLTNRYKSWARRRTALIDGLGMYMTGGDEDTPAYAVRMVDDLKDVCIMLDKFAEELYSVDAQLAHLDSLVQIHTGSALAMALRKLNTSFLKQVADNQVLRNQIQSLEAERDEAWQHAEDAANELDKMESQESSRRSSRISAVRKSSIRVSKAGLRTPNQRLSQLSSHGSGMHPFNIMPRSPMPRPQRIPPVPAIPRTRPPELVTDGFNRTSLALASYSPTSETEALIEAQDELYAMLGIKNPERPRRSRSISIMSGGSSAAPSSAHHTFLQVTRLPDTPSLHRRSSLPGNSTLAEAYNAMAADRNAVLATIDMLSSTD